MRTGRDIITVLLMPRCVGKRVAHKQKKNKAFLRHPKFDTAGYSLYSQLAQKQALASLLGAENSESQQAGL